MRRRVGILNKGWNDAMALNLFSREICFAVPSWGKGTRPPSAHQADDRFSLRFARNRLKSHWQRMRTALPRHTYNRLYRRVIPRTGAAKPTSSRSSRRFHASCGGSCPSHCRFHRFMGQFKPTLRWFWFGVGSKGDFAKVGTNIGTNKH